MSESQRQSDLPDQTGESAVPPRLAADLAEVFGRPPAVPGGMDWTILMQARASFARRRRFGLLLRWGGGAAAAAAVLVVGLWIGRYPQAGPGTPSVAQGNAEDARLDLNHDGKVDILDAYFLARQVRLGGALDKAWDFNCDGAIDEKDAQAVAGHAVELKRGVLQ